MTRINICLLLSFLSLAFSLNAQQAQGLDPVPTALNQSMPQANPKGIILEKDAAPGDGLKLEGLPFRVDLRQFLPPVKSQGPIGSCSAWSTVYYAKTIQENQERQWGAETEDHQYSPLFTYNQITGGVNRGTSIVDHMILIEKQGVPTLSVFPHTENIKILPDKNVLSEAEKYRSVSHRNLDQYNSKTQTWSVDLQTVKTALAEGLPVVGGFQVYKNFYDYKGGIYNRVEGSASGGHAMCIVGYDDRKGALLIVNSWGTWWGEDGFMWMDYDLFEPLCTYNCALMYDSIDSVPELISAPLDLSGTKGVYKDRIDLSWSAVEDADAYIIYKVNNKEGVLKEVAKTEEPVYLDEELPPGVSYVYAVKSVNRKKTGSLESDFSEIVEGWTAEVKMPPGIPANLDFAFYRKNPVLVWEPVEEAEGYNVYRWSAEKESFLQIGSSADSAYMDVSFSDIPDAGIIYYIVQAYNGYGEGYATDNLAILKELETVEEAVVIGVKETRDDVALAASEQEPFDGEYHRTDYFDYEYTMAQFKEFYKKEMEAFRDFQKEEKDDLEAWKKANDWRGN